MNKKETMELREFFVKNLLDTVSFWSKYAQDNEYGGIFTCLEEDGAIYNTDKSVWFQGRALWLYSRLYNIFEKRSEWLETAKNIHRFLDKYCFDESGKMYFTMTREGKPLQKRRYVYSEAFAIIGLAEYSKASGDKSALIKAKNLFERVLAIYKDPMGITPKIDPATRVVKGHSMPMILLATVQCLREIATEPRYDDLAVEFVETIFRDFYKPDEKALFENVGPSGERLNSPQGRLINPGHSIETAWFIMQEGRIRCDKVMMEKAAEILDCSLETGWDSRYGGLLYFVDIENKPLEQLEWDMKLWWPHTEALYATLLAYVITREEKYESWFHKIREYSFSHFSDPKNGEWFGYLHKDGSLSSTLKGSMWKGPFHLPRALLLCAKELENLS